MTKTFTVGNNKGGVGKTSLTAYLGAALARQGRTVLLIDLDAQTNLTSCFPPQRMRDFEAMANMAMRDYHIGHVLVGEAHIDEAIGQISENLFIINSTKDLLDYEEAISNKKRREDTLRKALRTSERNFDYILIDTPPHLGLCTNNALYASDFYLVPMQAEFFSYDGIESLIKHANEVSEDTGLELGGVILTRYNEKKKGLALQAIAKAIKDEPAYKCFTSYIRENNKIHESQLKHMSIFDYAPESNGAIDYGQLANEFLERYD